MFEKRDLCWLLKPVSKKQIVTWFMEDRAPSVTARTIEREMPLLFDGISRSQKEDASIVLSLAEEASLGDEGYSIDKTELGYEIRGNTQRSSLRNIRSASSAGGEEWKFPIHKYSGSELPDD
ncbi:hypothetical protein [Lacrimispora xylanisolvens]|uniref:hypothetical protein n=1 Tax=Lacrimispora xylanisolvens TaxID=384636 RepID=UPI002402B13A